MIKLLKDVLPIQRAQMRIRVVTPSGGKLIKNRLSQISVTESEEYDDDKITAVGILNILGCFYVHLLLGCICNVF